MTYCTRMITKQQRREALAKKIEITRQQLGSSKRHVYTAAGMSQTTYDRRISCITDFTFAELIDIADALGVTVSDLTTVDDAHQQEA